ncbi:MAG: DNA polymerase IV [Oscillospiraceae bacterium]|nr:DNA polymerase IV [Oscillospiraceae bacterium]
MSRNILHCDMNNFYASVECMLTPSLREHPVAVCGNVEERHGIVLAKNYKAKAFDVKTGDAVWQAKQKCPDLIVVAPHYEEYIKYSKLARSIYERFTDRVEPYGMDECWLDITGTEKIHGSPDAVADIIRKTIKKELGLTVSVGVSFCKIFAKLGSDMKKPDAVTVIPKDSFRDIIWDLPASDMLGVGRSTYRKLSRYCIRTIGDLARTDPDLLRDRLGKNGTALWNFANGRDISPVIPSGFASPVKSIGHGITTVTDMQNNDQAWPVFLELTQDIGHRLRVHQMCAQSVAIHVRDSTLFSRQWQTGLDIPTQSPMVIAESAFRLFRQRYKWENSVRSVTVQAINLINQDTPRQINMFMDYEKLERTERLDMCIENIRTRFGNDSIKNGILCPDIGMPPKRAQITMPTGMIG